MKRFYIAAGVLFLGTSAYAWAPSTAPVAQDSKAPLAVSPDKAPQAMLVAKSNDLPKVETASASWMGDDALTDKTIDKTIDKSADTTIQTAALGDPDLDLSVKPADGLAKSGPSEAVMQTSSTPAAAAYPPCRPGAGDDHCIQLYEPGVRAQLANWNRSAAGSESAMGGPYEPVDTTLAGEMGGTGAGTAARAMNGDGVIDPAIGETADAAASAGAQYAGVGGPLEEVAYPPCSRTVTDRCIQLYERGVTGR